MWDDDDDDDDDDGAVPDCLGTVMTRWTTLWNKEGHAAPD
jgi:hypothetical protein